MCNCRIIICLKLCVSVFQILLFRCLGCRIHCFYWRSTSWHCTACTSATCRSFNYGRRTRCFYCSWRSWSCSFRCRTSCACCWSWGCSNTCRRHSYRLSWFIRQLCLSSLEICHCLVQLFLAGCCIKNSLGMFNLGQQNCNSFTSFVT